MEKVRAFIAVEIPEEIRSQITRMLESFAKEDYSIKWVKQDNLHITLVFLGDVTQDFIQDAENELTQIVKTQKPFQISLAGIGAFPNPREPRIIWIGVSKGTNEIIDLQFNLENNCVKIGYKPESRKFHPHLTIGRVKFRFISPKIFENDYKSPEILVNSVSLFKSTLYPSGPIYERIQEFKFS